MNYGARYAGLRVSFFRKICLVHSVCLCLICREISSALRHIFFGLGAKNKKRKLRIFQNLNV